MDVKHHISTRTDGPVTTFVLIARAMRAVEQGCDSDTAANALYDALREFGAIVDGDDVLAESNEY